MRYSFYLMSWRLLGSLKSYFFCAETSENQRILFDCGEILEVGLCFFTRVAIFWVNSFIALKDAPSIKPLSCVTKYILIKVSPVIEEMKHYLMHHSKIKIFKLRGFCVCLQGRRSKGQ